MKGVTTKVCLLLYDPIQMLKDEVKFSDFHNANDKSPCMHIFFSRMHGGFFLEW